MKLILSQLKKISKPFHKRYKEEISDIIVFGSLMRGKKTPNDIDILIVFKNKINKDIEYEYKKLLRDVSSKFSLISKTEKSVQDLSFDARDGILFEGFSLINNILLSEKHGYKALGLFLYQTQGLSNLNKTKFYYALNGRGSSEGALKNLDGFKISDNILAVPLDKIELAKEFFEHWKLEMKYLPTLFPERLARKRIIGKR